MVDETITRAPSCADDYDPASLSCEAAHRKILDAVKPVIGREKLALRNALGRILGEDVCSSLNVPAHTNSAMDGYALSGAGLPAEGISSYAVIGTSWAGRPFTGACGNGECVRIMTGAVMPEGTDTVIMQEHVEREDDSIRIDASHKTGQNVRTAGEDISIGQTVLRAGIRLTPATLGLLASLGIGEIYVHRRLRVAFFSTGDELRSIGEPLDIGCIYDSNRYTLHGMLGSLGADVIDMGVIRDVREEVEKAFLEASEIADVVITSGGVSVGEADFIKEILEKVGSINLWKVAMKPGRPLAFGHLGKAVFFGLPGNPVSVMITFAQFTSPALRKMMGEEQIRPVSLKARCTAKLHKRPGRVEFQRGILMNDENGDLIVDTTGAQGSGILRSMNEANCLIVLPMDSGKVEPGTLVEVQPFSQFF